MAVDPVALVLISRPLALITKTKKLVALKPHCLTKIIANEEQEVNEHQGQLEHGTMIPLCSGSLFCCSSPPFPFQFTFETTPKALKQTH